MAVINKMRISYKKNRISGFTLAEVMICSVLFFLFVMIAGGLFLNVLKSYQKGEQIIRPVQNLRNTLYIINSSLKSASKIISITNLPDSELFLDKVEYEVPDEYGNTNRFILQVTDTSGIKNLQMTKSDSQNNIIFKKTLLTNLTKAVIVQQKNDIVLSVELGAMIDNKNNNNPIDDIKIELKSLVFMRPTQ